MKKDTEEKLVELIEDRVETLEAALEQAREENERLERDQQWTAHRMWDAKDLPVPRIEMHLECEEHTDGSVWEVISTLYLVYRHVLEHVEAVPLGKTRSNSTWRSAHEATHEQLPDVLGLKLPFRDGVHGHHDSEQLKLPFYATWRDEVWLCTRDAEKRYSQKKVRP